MLEAGRHFVRHPRSGANKMSGLARVLAEGAGVRPLLPGAAGVPDRLNQFLTEIEIFYLRVVGEYLLA
jgi:hypothetical protein